MRIFKAKTHFTSIGTIFFALMIMVGCATTIKYSYDTSKEFSGLKSYKWAPASGVYSQDSLLETNVQVLADQLLAQKGFTKVSENADLLISIKYESELGSSRYNYTLQMLTLNIYKSENKELVWMGTATGSICTDAAFDDLKRAVQGILLNFPPKSPK